jgi:hypothetical protein
VSTPNYPGGSFDAVSVTVNNTQYNYAGIQFGVKVASSPSALPGNGKPDFYAFCVDITHDANLSSAYQATPSSVSATLPNGSAIAYLYNKFNTPVGSPLSKTQAAGLQLAIWEEEYGRNIVTPTNVSFMDGYNGTAETNAVLSAAANYLKAVPCIPIGDATVYSAPNTQGLIGPYTCDYTPPTPTPCPPAPCGPHQQAPCDVTKPTPTPCGTPVPAPCSPQSPAPCDAPGLSLCETLSSFNACVTGQAPNPYVTWLQGLNGSLCQL